MTPPLKWHGGKHYLAKRIVGMLPSHLHYVEPYAGGLSVLLTKNPEGVSEVVCDLHKDLINFWKVLQGGNSFASFQRLCEATPFSQIEWDNAHDEFSEYPEPVPEYSDQITRAWRFFVHCRQSLAGRQDSFAPLSRTRIRRGMNEQASAWLTCIEGLPQVHARLKRVVILDGPALKVIRQQDGPDTCFYSDPPYLDETRTAPEVYRHEMSRDDHAELLDCLNSVKGSVVLSGYRSALYDRELAGWYREEHELPNNSAGGKSKRRMVEVTWLKRAKGKR